MSQGFPITPSARLAGPYTASAAQVAFSVTFPFQREADLLVQIRASAADAWSAAILGTDYTVTGAGASSGGVVTFLVGRAAGSQVRVLGLAVISAELDMTPANAVDSQSLNRFADRTTIWAQELRRDVDALGAAIASGSNGWSPILSLVLVGQRIVQQVVDWTAGTGVKPAAGLYVGAAGLVADAADAVDIRGAQGSPGVQGPAGSQGPAGAAGAQGATGPQGPQGAAGPQGIQGPAGATGPEGPPGAGVTILGSVGTAGELPGSGSLGDAYVVGADLYVWTGSAWENVGPFRGPQGAAGAAGATGPEGPQGPAGATGAQGATGPAGPGVAAGGAAAQLLAKNSATDFDTTWVTPGKSLVGLGNVDNTADMDKPVSTLTGAALDAKLGRKLLIRYVSGDYTLVADDTGRLIIHSGTGKIIVPTGLEATFFVTILSQGGGTTTVEAAAGATIWSRNNLFNLEDRAFGTIVHHAGNVFYFGGDRS